MNQLDPALRDRLELLRESGQIDAEVAEFLEGALPKLAERVGVPANEAHLGMLTTHVALALQRTRTGEALREWDGAGSDEVPPELTEAAEGFVLEAAGVARNEIPAQEVKFIAMHLGAARLKD